MRVILVATFVLCSFVHHCSGLRHFSSAQRRRVLEERTDEWAIGGPAAAKDELLGKDGHGQRKVCSRV